MYVSKYLKYSLLTAVLGFAAGCGERSEKSPAFVEDAEGPAVVEEGLNFEDLTVKESYAVGLGAGASMRANIESLAGTDIELDTAVIIQAFADGLLEEAQLDDEAMQETMNAFRIRLNEAMAAVRKAEAANEAKKSEENLEIGKTFLQQNKSKEGVVALESGLQYRVIKSGSGASPSSTDRVKVHYTGTLIDGSKFDSSHDRGEPSVFGVNQVIQGWTEALQLMKEGAVWELYIPADIAYGSASRPTIPGNSVLIFTVELIEIVGNE